MKIKKKIICTITFAIIVVSALITTFTLMQMYKLKSDTVKMMSSENEKLSSDIVDTAKKSKQERFSLVSQDMIRDFKQKIEIVEADITIVKSRIEQIYKGEVELVLSNAYDKKPPIIRKGVNYNDIAGEFNKIKGIKILMESLDEISLEGQTYYLTDSGITILSHADGEYNKIEDVDRRKKNWYDGAVKNKGIYLSEVYVDTLTSKPMVTCSISVHDPNGNVKGVVAKDIDVNQFTTDILGKNMSSEKYAFIMKQDGTFLIGSTGKSINDYISDEGMNQLQEYIKGNDFKDSIFIDDKYMLSGSNMEDLDIFIGLLVLNDYIFNDANRVGESIEAFCTKVVNYAQHRIDIIIIILAILVTLSIIISLWVSLFLAKKIVNPISVITEGAKKISEGDFNYNISVNTNDELKDLAVAFNNMTKKIREYIKNLAIATAEEERIATELDVAKKTQLSMLPCVFPPFPNNKEFDIMALMNPTKEVGGDFYDFFFVDDEHLAFVIADVSGKGVPAALFMVVAKTLIKNSLQQVGDPAETLNVVNNQLCENNEANMFVTAFVSILDIKTGELKYCNAGHNPPLIYSVKTKKYKFIKPKPNFILAAMKDLNYKNETTRLEKGERIFCYTDGVTEAMNKEEKMYSEKRLLETLNSENIRNASLKLTVELVRKDIKKFSDGAAQFDDITMMVVERKL